MLPKKGHRSQIRFSCYGSQTSDPAERLPGPLGLGTRCRSSAPLHYRWLSLRPVDRQYISPTPCPDLKHQVRHLITL